MNKVFKIVWSKSKQCYVVVSEYAKSNGGKKKVLATVLAGLMMAGVAGGLAPQQALAGADYGNSSVNIAPNHLYQGYENTINKRIKCHCRWGLEYCRRKRRRNRQWSYCYRFPKSSYG